MSTLFKFFKKPNRSRKSTKFIKETKKSLLPSNDELTTHMLPSRPRLDLCTVSNDNDEDEGDISTVFMHGYEPIQTPHLTSDQFRVRSTNNETKDGPFTVKRIPNHNEILDVGNNEKNHFFVETNPKNEALLLQNCTDSNSNKTYSKYITKYVDFFHDERYAYLVFEDGQTNLRDWVTKAFEYMRSAKLALNEYRKIIKYIFWQISLVIYWLHNQQKLCHLGITVDSFTVLNGEFIKNSNGRVNIPKNIQIKLGNFSNAQVFQSKSSETYQKATKIDVCQLGTLLYFLAFGESVSEHISKCKALQSHLRLNNLMKYTTVQMFELLTAMLCYDEIERLDAFQVIRSKWFNTYYTKYKSKINKTLLLNNSDLSNKFELYRR